MFVVCFFARGDKEKMKRGFAKMLSIRYVCATRDVRVTRDVCVCMCVEVPFCMSICVLCVCLLCLFARRDEENMKRGFAKMLSIRYVCMCV
jgi:hypothetical protein